MTLAKTYLHFYTCRICSTKSRKGRKEKPRWTEEKEEKQTFVCEDCLIKNKEGKISLGV